MHPSKLMLPMREHDLLENLYQDITWKQYLLKSKIYLMAGARTHYILRERTTALPGHELLQFYFI